MDFLTRVWQKIKREKKVGLFFALGIILMICIVFLGATSRTNQRNELSSNVVLPTAEPTQVMVKKGTSLTFNPQNLTLRPGQQFTFDITLINPGNMVSAADIKIVFDPDMLYIAKPAVGDLFAGQVVLDNTVDNKRGLVSLTLSGTSPASQSGALVRLTGAVNQGVTGETDLIILPDSKITWTGSGSSILEQTGQATISVIVL